MNRSSVSQSADQPVKAVDDGQPQLTVTRVNGACLSLSEFIGTTMFTLQGTPSALQRSQHPWGVAAPNGVGDTGCQSFPLV